MSSDEPAGNAPIRLQRLTQPDWCNAPRPGSWRDACMRTPGHDGDHAVRKSYRWSEAFYWPAHGGYPVKWRDADAFPDLWHPDNDALASSAVHVPPADAAPDRYIPE